MNALKNQLKFLIFIFLFFESLFAIEPPKISPCLNDYSKVISPEYTNKISQICQELKNNKTVELAILILPSTNPYDINSFAQKTFEKNSIGKKGEDNGLLLVIATEDRKWRLEVGYGLEGTLPDGKVGQIARESLVPYLKNGSYELGTYYFVTEIANEIKTNYQTRSQINKGSSLFDEPLMIIIIAIILIFVGIKFGFGKLSFRSGAFGSRRTNYSPPKNPPKIGFGGGRSGGGGASGSF